MSPAAYEVLLWSGRSLRSVMALAASDPVRAPETEDGLDGEGGHQTPAMPPPRFADTTPCPPPDWMP